MLKNNSMFEEIFTNENVVIFLQITLSMLLGLVLGVERSIAGKTAGMRTYALVAMGSCLLIVSSTIFITPYIGFTPVDPLRISAGIIAGMGFLGAGIIIFREATLRGLTTAAGLWVAAGIGITVGYGLYVVAIFTTLLTLFIFTALWFLEEFLESNLTFSRNNGENHIQPNQNNVN